MQRIRKTEFWQVIYLFILHKPCDVMRDDVRTGVMCNPNSILLLGLRKINYVIFLIQQLGTEVFTSTYIQNQYRIYAKYLVSGIDAPGTYVQLHIIAKLFHPTSTHRYIKTSCGFNGRRMRQGFTVRGLKFLNTVNSGVSGLSRNRLKPSAKGEQGKMNTKVRIRRSIPILTSLKSKEMQRPYTGIFTRVMNV